MKPPPPPPPPPRSSDDDFSVLVIASDLGVDARSLLTPSERRQAADEWHDCAAAPPNEDFSDIDALQAIRVEGSDKAGNSILRIVGKFFPAPVISGERLKRYVFSKMEVELAEGPFCIVYIHSTVQSEDNNPGISVLRWIYEELPPDYKERLQLVYFVHPGLWSRLTIATLGRLFLSGGWAISNFILRDFPLLPPRDSANPDCINFDRVFSLAVGWDFVRNAIVFALISLYWKVKYVSRLQYLWEDIKKGQVEIPEFALKHDEVLERRPLTDYGIEPDPLHLADMSSSAFGRYESGWAAAAPPPYL